MYVYVEALQLQESLAEITVPLDRIRAARHQLSFIWCSILAAVSLLVVLHLFAAAFQRFLVAGRLRHLFEAPPLADVQSPAADVPAGRASADCDSVPATADRTTVDKEQRGHRHRVSCSRHSALQLPPSTVDRISPPYVSHDDRSHRFQFPTATATRSTQLSSSKISHKSPMHVEGIYYTDSIVESNV